MPKSSHFKTPPTHTQTSEGGMDVGKEQSSDSCWSTTGILLSRKAKLAAFFNSEQLLQNLSHDGGRWAALQSRSSNSGRVTAVSLLGTWMLKLIGALVCYLSPGIFAVLSARLLKLAL